MTEIKEQWVSVDEELPEDGERVLAVVDYGERQEIETYAWDRWWKLNGIIYWQRLPAPPNKKPA